MTWQMTSAIVALMILAACGKAPDSTSTPTRAAEDSFRVAVHIPEAERFVAPLSAALEAQQLGKVHGADTAQQRIDVNLNAESGLPALRAELQKLDASESTMIEYRGSDGLGVQEPLWEDDAAAFRENQ